MKNKLDKWSCGHEGFPSIYPDENGHIQCTVCSNAERFGGSWIYYKYVLDEIKDNQCQ